MKLLSYTLLLIALISTFTAAMEQPRKFFDDYQSAEIEANEVIHNDKIPTWFLRYSGSEDNNDSRKRSSKTLHPFMTFRNG